MFISDSIKTEIVTVTPRLAKKLLEMNTRNRKISPGNLAKVTLQMQRDEWKLNGEAIKIAKDGRILDGQHRLMASINTDTTFETLIVYGLDDDTQVTMDTGKVRPLGTLLGMKGYKDGNTLAAIATAIIRSEQWSIRAAVSGGSNSFTITNQQVFERLELEPSIVDLPGLVKRHARIGIPGKTAGLLYYKFSEIDGEDAQDFFERLRSGADLERGHPVLTLRNTLSALKNNAKGQINQRHVAAITIKAWNKYRDGDSSSQLKFRVGGANPETFPEPH